MNEGHGFSRADKLRTHEGFSPLRYVLPIAGRELRRGVDFAHKSRKAYLRG